MSEGGQGVVRLSPAAARLVGTSTERRERLQAARGEMPLEPAERLTVLCLLACGRDAEIAATACDSLLRTASDDVVTFLGDPGLHPRFLDLAAQLFADDEKVCSAVALHPFTARQRGDRKPSGQVSGDAPHGTAGAPEDETEEAVEGEEIAFQSHYQLAQHLGIAERIKLALTGDKEWRALLIKDTIKPICCAVLRNPRITEGEVLTIARSTVQYDDIIRIICGNREWLKNYQIRKSLVENHRTPLQTALKLLGTLSEKDLAAVARNKNVSSVIATQARKMVAAKTAR